LIGDYLPLSLDPSALFAPALFPLALECVVIFANQDLSGRRAVRAG
jgi:hypothetical protein